MLFVISFISNIVFYIIEYMVNRLFFCIKNVIILDGYFKKIYIYNIWFVLLLILNIFLVYIVFVENNVRKLEF